MNAMTQGDPGPHLTRDDIDGLHAAMVAAEPDWTSSSATLASTLESALLQLRSGYNGAWMRSTLDEFYQAREAWLRAADAYFVAVGGPIQEVAPLEFDDAQG